MAPLTNKEKAKAHATASKRPTGLNGDLMAWSIVPCFFLLTIDFKRFSWCKKLMKMAAAR